MQPTLPILSRELERAIEQLGPHDIALLFDLAIRADLATGRVNVCIEDLAVRLAAPLDLVRRSLGKLARYDFIEHVATQGESEMIDVGDLLIRRNGAPKNLPIEPPI